MYDRKVPTENPARTLLLAVLLWGGAVAVAAAAGVFSKFAPPLIAAFVGFAFAFATASYYLDRAVRGRIDATELRVLALINVWRILAGVAFLAYGAAGMLPQAFAQIAGWGDVLIGVSAIALLVLRGSPRAHFAFHVAGLADLLLAVTLGLHFTLIGDAAMTTLALLPMVMIPLFGVPLTATLHIAALDRLVRQKAWKAAPLSTRISSVSPFA